MTVATHNMTAADVAAHYGMSKSTVLRHVKNGKLPQPLRLGRIVRWSREALPSMADLQA